jgi:hypothetical protein
VLLAFYIVKRHCIGEGIVLLDHDSLLSELVKRQSGVDSTPIKLHRASDTVDTGAKNQDTVVVKSDIVGAGVICGVPVTC